MQAQPVSGTTRVPTNGAAEPGDEAQRSGVSWGAIIAGAVAAAAVSIVLYLLGSGLGFSAMSPYEDNSAVALGIGAILWLSFTQLAASALGGYLAGRLRVKWSSIHNDEVYFRDTAHGMLTWALSTLVTAAFFGGIMSKMLGTAADAGAGVAKTAMMSGAAAAGAASDEGGVGANPLDYFSDMLMRSDKPAAQGAATALNDPGLRQEAMRILATSVKNGALAPDDRAYLARRVAEHTGMDPAAAQQRVDEVYNRGKAAADKATATAKDAADKARKAAAGTALWLTVALLLGAFVASWCATLGGKQRDGLAAVSDR
ncbi:hypothetical protein [Massilia niabensis]|uniref:Transmembrane protein n=1 Tax=Massilia niabensis TaxID=544910 RepID=A0ABW0L8U1_9BURK